LAQVHPVEYISLLPLNVPKKDKPIFFMKAQPQLRNVVALFFVAFFKLSKN